MNKKKTLIIVLITIMIGFAGYRIYDNHVYKNSLKHYDDIYELITERKELMAEDGLTELHTLRGRGENSYTNTDKYVFDQEFTSIDFKLTQMYREFMMECGFHSDTMTFCETDDNKGAYMFTKLNDVYSIEVYFEIEGSVEHLTMEYMKNEYIHLSDVFLNEDGTVTHGNIFKYTAKENIVYYKITNDQIVLYEIFDMDDFIEFGFREYLPVIQTPPSIMFYEEEADITYLFHTEENMDTLKDYTLHFYNDLSEYSVLSLRYEDFILKSVLMNAEYITNWSEFYNDNCRSVSTTEQPFPDLCSRSHASYIFLFLEEYPSNTVDEIVSLSAFGLTFDEVTGEDIARAQTYLFNTYETIEADFNFDRTNRGIDQFDIQEILEYDTQVLHELLD